MHSTLSLVLALIGACLMAYFDDKTVGLIGLFFVGVWLVCGAIENLGEKK